MKKYEELQVEVVLFTAADVFLLTSEEEDINNNEFWTDNY